MAWQMARAASGGDCMCRGRDRRPKLQHHNVVTFIPARDFELCGIATVAGRAGEPPAEADGRGRQPLRHARGRCHLDLGRDQGGVLQEGAGVPAGVAHCVCLYVHEHANALTQVRRLCHWFCHYRVVLPQLFRRVLVIDNKDVDTITISARCSKRWAALMRQRQCTVGHSAYATAATTRQTPAGAQSPPRPPIQPLDPNLNVHLNSP